VYEFLLELEELRVLRLVRLYAVQGSTADVAVDPELVPDLTLLVYEELARALTFGSFRSSRVC